MTIPRLMLDASLADDAHIPLSADQSRYLLNVLRLENNAEILVFNGRDGEWRASLSMAGKRAAAVQVRQQTRAQRGVPDIAVLFAPLKKTRTDFLVEKTTELGVASLRPVYTQRTVAARVNTDRLSALAREAAEQSERLETPQIAPPQKLDVVLDAWSATDGDRQLVFCDEATARDTSWGRADADADGGRATSTPWRDLPRAPGPWALLIGPEGGFTAAERARLHAAPFAQPISLGPRILRADTAAVAALTLWMAQCGDWGQARNGPPA